MTPSKSSIGIRSQRLDLSSGSLLIMGGQTQENWKVSSTYYLAVGFFDVLFLARDT